MKAKRYESVWDAIEATPQAAASMRARSALMIEISEHIQRSGWTQREAAKMLGVTQPRLNQLLKGKIGIFSLDALVNMATSAGMRVGLNIRPVTSVRVRNTAAPKTAQPAKRRLRA